MFVQRLPNAVAALGWRLGLLLPREYFNYNLANGVGDPVGWLRMPYTDPGLVGLVTTRLRSLCNSGAEAFLGAMELRD